MALSVPRPVVHHILDYCGLDPNGSEGIPIRDGLYEVFTDVQHTKKADEIAHQLFISYDTLSSATFNPDDDHTQRSRALILEGADLCGRKDRVIVLAPGPLEPIKELSKLFKEVVLVGYDPALLAKFATGLHNVTLIQCDLTGGLFGRISAIFERARIEKQNRHVVVCKLYDLLRDDRKKKGDDLSALGLADYVISSNLLSQLSECIYAYCKEFDEKLPKGSSNQSDMVMLVKHTFEEWDEVLSERHIENLSQLTRSSSGAPSIVCLADTITRGQFEITNGKREWVSEVRFSEFGPGLESVTEKINKTFVVEKTSKWLWDIGLPGIYSSDPTRGYGYGVKAFLLKSPPTG